MKYVKLNWSNWNYICSFVDNKYFITGVFLDDKTKKPLTIGLNSNTIGLYLKINNKDILVKQNDYIIKYNNNTIKVLTNTQFNRLQKLKKLKKI